MTYYELGLSMAIIGLLGVMTPSILFMMDGGKDDADIWSWFSKQPLWRLINMNILTLGSIAIMILGVVLMSLPAS